MNLKREASERRLPLEYALEGGGVGITHQVVK